MSYVKYPRTPHLPWSPGCTSDDKILKDLNCFVGKQIVVTEKMDGENTTMYSNLIHARSLDSLGGVDRDWVKSLWASSIRFTLPDGWRICGENLWAKHSIQYSDLESYFYAFSVWNSDNICLSWPDTTEFLDNLGLYYPKVLYYGVYNQEVLTTLSDNLDYTRTEGFVVRLEEGFPYEDFGKSVAKFVRRGHVQTDEHWRHKHLERNLLVNKNGN